MSSDSAREVIHEYDRAAAAVPDLGVDLCDALWHRLCRDVVGGGKSDNGMAFPGISALALAPALYHAAVCFPYAFQQSCQRIMNRVAEDMRPKVESALHVLQGTISDEEQRRARGEPPQLGERLEVFVSYFHRLQAELQGKV